MTLSIDEFSEADDGVVARMKRLRRCVYDGDDHFCRPFEGRLEQELRRPTYIGRQRLFVARRSGEDLACAVARRPEALRLDGKPVATIGKFEALEDSQATTELLSRAAVWAADKGAETVVGPLSGDTWHTYRFNLGSYDEPPFLREPYNPPYYPVLWENAGFEVLATYHSRRIDDIAGACRHHASRWADAESMGYRIEPMTRERIDEALERVFDMVCVCFADNFLYTPIRRSAFMDLYDGVEILLDEEMSFFLVDEEGRDAGFAFVLPDYARAVRAMKGRKHLWSKAKFLANRRTKTANIKTFGIMPEHRGKGLASAMAHKYFAAIEDRGFERANICLIHDENVGSIKMDGERGRVLRRYALYHTTGGAR